MNPRTRNSNQHVATPNPVTQHKFVLGADANCHSDEVANPIREQLRGDSRLSPHHSHPGFYCPF